MLTNRKKCMVYPDMNCKTNWDLLITIVLIFSCIVTPFRIAFTEKDDIPWIVINFTIDIIFFMDVIVNFNSIIIDEDC